MLKIAIFDDDPEIEAILIKQLKLIDNTLDIVSFPAWKPFEEYLNNNAGFDVVFMDLHFDKQTRSGIDYAEKIISVNSETKIIYITGYPLEYAEKIFLSTSVRPYGFIVKPIQKDLLCKYINSLYNNKNSVDDTLNFKSVGGNIEFLRLNDILYFNSHKRYVTAHTKTESFTGYYKLTDLIKQLPKYFYMCHKSYIVNVKKIQRIEARFLLINDDEIPISSINNTSVPEKRQDIIRIKSHFHEQKEYL
ncbi:MAG: response regulator transcription factor [Ruminococcus sp.]|nr:response regulator transcription factor [Ruminococcus sp.]